MGGITVTQRFRIAKIIPFWYQRWPPWRPSWNSSNNIFFQIVSPIELKLDGRHHSDKDSKLLKSFLPLSKMATMAAILKLFKRRVLPNRKLDWAKTWWEASQWHRDSELLKWFRSNIQDGHHGGHLEILQTTSQTISWMEPKLDGRHHSDTEIQNC